MTIDQWIVDAAQRSPQQTAIAFKKQDKQQHTSYADFANLVDSKTNDLLDAGIQRGDRIAWYGLNHPQAFVLLFACARIGAMLVPLNWRLATPEVAAIVANCEPSLVFHDEHFALKAQALPNVTTVALGERIKPSINTHPLPDANPASLDDPILLVYTSGSTGIPKGAVLTQRALVSNAAMSIHAHNMSDKDRVLVMLPIFHVGGMNILPTPAFSIGATVVLHDRFEPESACEALSNTTLVITVPTVLQAMMACKKWTDINWSNMRGMSIGSTDVPTALIDAMHKLDIPMIQIYGATETGPFAIYQTLDEAKDSVGSIGRAGCDCNIRLVSNNKDVDINEPGEIWVKGDNVLKEYWRDPDLTKKMLHNSWFRTGDVATVDTNGLFWFKDRIKNVIISGGENIYPTEIERILNQAPDIIEATVVGQADAKWGEIPVAVVVSNTDMTPEIVLDRLKGKLANYKHPKKVVFVEALPRNVMGKVVAAKVHELISTELHSKQ